MGRVAIICLSIVMFVLVAFAVNYFFFSEPKIITVYHDVDLRDDSVVVILENAPANNKAMYDFWLKNKPLLKEKYDVDLNNNTRFIAFMNPLYMKPKYVENEYCFSKYIKGENQCIDKDQIEFGISYEPRENYFILFFNKPFCVTHFFNGQSLSSSDKCFK